MNEPLDIYEAWKRNHFLFTEPFDQRKADWEGASLNCKRAGIDAVSFVRGATARRPSDDWTNWAFHIRHLKTDVALLRFRDWLVGHGNPVEMEVAAIRRTKEVASSADLVMPVPPILAKIRKREVSVLYYAAQPDFRETVGKLPQDLRDEFLDGIEVGYIHHKLRNHERLMEVINE